MKVNQLSLFFVLLQNSLVIKLCTSVMPGSFTALKHGRRMFLCFNVMIVLLIGLDLQNTAIFDSCNGWF